MNWKETPVTLKSVRVGNIMQGELEGCFIADKG